MLMTCVTTGLLLACGVGHGQSDKDFWKETELTCYLSVAAHKDLLISLFIVSDQRMIAGRPTVLCKTDYHLGVRVDSRDL